LLYYILSAFDFLIKLIYNLQSLTIRDPD